VKAGVGRWVAAVTICLCVGAAPAWAAAPFPDVPPWHWAAAAVAADQAAGLVIGYPSTPAELIANAVTQVYDGFLHAAEAGSQAWVERFTYDRPAEWPASLHRVQLVAFDLSGMRITVGGDVATAAFTASVVPHPGAAAITRQIQARLRYNGQDWQVDYAPLAAADSTFR